MLNCILNKCQLFVCFIALLTWANQAVGQVKFQKSYYYHPTDTFSEQSIFHQPFTLLEKAYQTPSFHNNGLYWFRLNIIHNPLPTADLIVNIANPHLDTVVLFQNISGKIIPTDTSGNNFKLQDSSYLRYTRFRVPGNTSVIWFKTRLKKEITFSVAVMNAPSFHRTEHLNFFWLGLYYGFVLMVLAINITFYFTFKDLKFIYYGVFLSLIALTFAYADGLFVLLSRTQVWLNYTDLPLQLAVAVAGAVFATNFLELDNVYPRLRWVGVTLVGVMFGCYTLHLISGGAAVYFAGNVAGLLLVSLYWLAGLFRFKTDVFARFFVLAYGLLLIFAFDFFFFRVLGWKFLNFSPTQLKVASILEMVVLSFAIVYRVKKIQQEHNYYRKEIQRYIEASSVAEAESLSDCDGTNASSRDLQQHFNLSDRELEVLHLVVNGLSNQEIGEKLFLSINTVKFHVRNVYLKMDINNRAQAVSRVHSINSTPVH